MTLGPVHPGSEGTTAVPAGGSGEDDPYTSIHPHTPIANSSFSGMVNLVNDYIYRYDFNFVLCHLMVTAVFLIEVVS